MADRRFEQGQLILHADLLELRPGCRVHMCTASPVGRVDPVNIVHEFQRLLPADVPVKSAAEIICDIVLPVRKCTGSSESVHYGTDPAADTGLDFLPVDRTFALLQLMPCLEHSDTKIRAEMPELPGRKDASRPGSDDHHIIFFSIFHKFPHSISMKHRLSQLPDKKI